MGQRDKVSRGQASQLNNTISNELNKWKLSSYSIVVQLDGNRYMPQQQSIGSSIGYTLAANPVAGASNYVRLIADGIITPTFTGFLEHGSSFGYDNTSGIINNITFWYDSVDAWYSIAQEVNATPLIVPVLSSSIIANATPTTLTLTYSQTLDTNSVPDISAFSISNSGGTDNVTNVSVSGSTVILTKSRTTLSTDVISMSYTIPNTNQIKSQSSGLLASNLSNNSVTNNVSSLTVVRLTSTTGVTESGDATDGWNYVPTSLGDFTGGNGGVSASKIASSGDGYYQFKITSWTAGTRGALLALHTSQARVTYTSTLFSIYITSSTNDYRVSTGGTGNQTPSTPRTAQVNDIIRIGRTGDQGYVSVSSDNGVTFTTLNTWASITTADVWSVLLFGATTSTASNIRGSGVS